MITDEPISHVTQDMVIPVDELTFLVPARTFRIEGTLLKGGYVSLATEFALRLLRDVGELPPAEVGAFFGFSERETRALIKELLLDFYIDVSSDRVRLSQRGEDAFNPVTGEFQMLNIEPFGDTLSLDLIAFAPIDDTAGGARMPWLSVVKIPDKTKAAAATEAGQDGFQSNFGEWRERKFKGGIASTVRLQTVDKITPLGRPLIPLTILMNYVPSTDGLIEPDFSYLRNRGRRGSREKLVNVLSNMVRSITAPGDHLSAADVTAEWDRGILKRPGSTATSMLSWLQVMHRGVPELPGWLAPSIRLAGSMMVPALASRLVEFIGSAVQSDGNVPPVFWLPAEHAAWGRSATVSDVVRKLNSEESGIVLLARSNTDNRSRRELVRQYGVGKDGDSQPLFAACLAVPPSALPLSLELIVQPKRWAVALIHIPAPKTGYPVPIGYASTNPDVIDAISNRLADVITEAGEVNVFWASAGIVPMTALEEFHRHLLSTE